MRTKVLSRFVPTVSRFEIRGLLLGLAAAATISSSAHAAIIVVTTGPYFTSLGTPLTLDATGSQSLSGTDLHFSWDFGDGTQSLSDTTNYQVSHTYFGYIGKLFNIKLTATSGIDGLESGTAVTSVTMVEEQNPMPPFPGPGPQPVSSVPEPATWAMMLLGFGGIGFAMRRRKSGVAQLT